MILLIMLLAFALFTGLVVELYKKTIRKDKSSDIENRLVAFALSAVFALVCFFVIAPSGLPDGMSYSPWLIALFTVAIYILQLPACLAFWKPIVKKILEKKTDA